MKSDSKRIVVRKGERKRERERERELGEKERNWRIFHDDEFCDESVCNSSRNKVARIQFTKLFPFSSLSFSIFLSLFLSLKESKDEERMNEDEAKEDGSRKNRCKSHSV